MIYIVYECDNHRNYNSICVKEIFTNRQKAIAYYNKGVRLFNKQGESDWYINLARHVPRMNESFDNNVLRDMVLIKSNEENV